MIFKMWLEQHRIFMVFYNIQSIIFIFNQNHTKHGFSRKRYIFSINFLCFHIARCILALCCFALWHCIIAATQLGAVGSWTAPGPWQKNHESVKGNRDDRGGIHHRSQPPLKNHSTKIIFLSCSFRRSATVTWSRAQKRHKKHEVYKAFVSWFGRNKNHALGSGCQRKQEL